MSLLYVMEDGASAGIAVAGNEGMPDATAWLALRNAPERLQRLADFPWLRAARSQAFQRPDNRDIRTRKKACIHAWLQAFSGTARNISWCPEPESNRHLFQERCLRPSRLPIPPSGHAAKIFPPGCHQKSRKPKGQTQPIDFTAILNGTMHAQALNPDTAAPADQAIPARPRHTAGRKERALSRISPDPTSRPRRRNATCH